MKRFFYINKRYIKEFVKSSAEVFIITLVVYIFGLLFLLIGKFLNIIPNVKDLTPILSTVIGVILGLYIEKIRLTWKRINLKYTITLELKLVIAKLTIYVLECYFRNRVRFRTDIRKSLKELENLYYLYHYSGSVESLDLNSIEGLVEDMESVGWIFEIIKKYEDAFPRSIRKELHYFLLFRRVLYQVFENIKTLKDTSEIESFIEKLRKNISEEDISLFSWFHKQFNYKYKGNTSIETYFIKKANIENLNDLDPSFAVKVLYILGNLDRLNQKISSALDLNYCTDVDIDNMRLLIFEIEDLLAKEE
jgi:hypothetical protein